MNLHKLTIILGVFGFLSVIRLQSLLSSSLWTGSSYNDKDDSVLDVREAPASISVSRHTTQDSKQEYRFHPDCACVRLGPNLKEAEQKFDPDIVKEARDSGEPWNPPLGSYVGNSTCNSYTTALGSGQRVLTYTYYTPWHQKGQGKKFLRNGRPNDDSAARYAELFQPLADSVRKLYPGWRMRIYHNVTVDDDLVWGKLCDLYCNNHHVDLCDTRDIPGLGDLNKNFPIGRFWRFQALGDPTVEMFGSRDVDSYLMPRERAAVEEWILSRKQFHVMRDGPFHINTVLAGLWGAKNYRNFRKATTVRNRLLGVPVNHNKFYDQAVLHKMVWPLMRNFAMVHDSYNCEKGPGMGRMRAWPTQRDGYLYVGYGPTKGYAVRILRFTKCPIACRPKHFKYWSYC